MFEYSPKMPYNLSLEFQKTTNSVINGLILAVITVITKNNAL